MKKILKDSSTRHFGRPCRRVEDAGLTRKMKSKREWCHAQSWSALITTVNTFFLNGNHFVHPGLPERRPSREESRRLLELR